MAQTLSDARSAKLVDCLPANQTVRFDSVRFGWVWFFCHAKRCSGTGSGAAGVACAARIADNGISVGSQLSNASGGTYTAASLPATLSAAHSNVPVGRDPTFIRCPSCQSDVVTVIHSTSSKRTHAAALILCFVG